MLECNVMRLYKIIRQNRGGANYGPQLVCAHILLTQSEKMISDHGKAMICTTGRPPPLLEKYYGIIMVLIRWYFGTVNFTMVLLTMVLTVKYTMANAPCITIMDTATDYTSNVSCDVGKIFQSQLAFSVELTAI